MDDKKPCSQILAGISYTGSTAGDFIRLECKCRKYPSFGR